MNGDSNINMKIFNAIMLTVCSMSCGMKLMSGSWILAGGMALCTIYWFVTLVKPEKKITKEFEVNISDEAKQFMADKNIKVVVNGVEVN